MFKLRPVEDTVTEKLHGYEEVTRDEWMELPPGSYVRYENSGGKLVKGGFIINRSLVNSTIEMRSELNNAQSPTWVVPIKSIKRLWKKIGENSDSTISKILKSLHERIAALEAEERGESRDYSGEMAQMKNGLDNLREDFKRLIVVVGELVDANNKEVV